MAIATNVLFGGIFAAFYFARYYTLSVVDRTVSTTFCIPTFFRFAFSFFTFFKGITGQDFGSPVSNNKFVCAELFKVWVFGHHAAAFGHYIL